MASATLNVADAWPDGTTVGAYLRSQWPTENLSGSPSGSAAATASVSSGQVTITGLSADTRYVAWASGFTAFRRFKTDVAPAGYGRTFSANTPYKAGDVISYQGFAYAAIADFTSAASFNSSDWTAIGRAELAYAEITAGVTSITSTSYVDITGLSITFTAPSRPVLLELFASQIDNGTAAQATFLAIVQGSSTVVEDAYSTSSTTLASHPFIIKRRLSTLTAGTSYTFKGQVKVSANTAEIQPRTGAIYLLATQL